MLISKSSSKGEKISSFNQIILFILFLSISSAIFFEQVYSKKHTFKLRNTVNVSHWKKKLFHKAIDKLKISKRIKFRLPKIPKIKQKRIIKKVDTKKHNPCNMVKNICLNGGICQSVGDEWYCDCPKTHYGRSCEFIADQLHCSGNLCKNNSTCYSVKSMRTVPNPDMTEVKRCSKDMMKNSALHKRCNYTLNVMHKCWCRYGYEGAFCEFTEGMRCCAEDHCNHHGKIEYNNPAKYATKMEKDDEVATYSCDRMNCTCDCEEYYSNEDNCLTISPCRDHECLNGGKCEIDKSSGGAICHCPNAADFLVPGGVIVSGKNCDDIETGESNECLPCEGTGGFRQYIECVQKKLDKKSIGLKIANFFAKDCIAENGEHKECVEALGNGFCLNCREEGNCCQISVANLNDLLEQGGPPQKDQFFLVPKCECPPNYEGDFCENHMLDECDLRDLEEHQAYLEESGQTDQKLQKMGTEQFVRAIKTVFGQWRPAGIGQNAVEAVQGYEQALRERGMRTFCGLNGYCRPYDEEEGMSCKCDYGYKGSKCEVKDPCAPNHCLEQHTNLCVDIPIVDDASAEAGALTYACICDTSQVVDPKKHVCTMEHSDLYDQYCYEKGEGRVPMCANSGSCYPCALDQRIAESAKIGGDGAKSLAICSEEEARRGFRCVCPPGFESARCRHETTGCDFHRCQNGAKCENMPELDYRCICPPGYGPHTNDTLCEIIEAICIVGASKCKNGICVEDSAVRRGFRCECHTGYSGFNCERHNGREDMFTYINDNYRWAYAVILFSAILPIFLLVSAIKDGLITCNWATRIFHRLLQRIRGRKGGRKYEPLKEEAADDDVGNDGEKSNRNQKSTHTAKSASPTTSMVDMKTSLLSQHQND